MLTVRYTWHAVICVVFGMLTCIKSVCGVLVRVLGEE